MTRFVELGSDISFTPDIMVMPLWLGFQTIVYGDREHHLNVRLAQDIRVCWVSCELCLFLWQV